MVSKQGRERGNVERAENRAEKERKEERNMRHEVWDVKGRNTRGHTCPAQ